MSPYSLTLLLVCTLLGVNHCQIDCSFNNLLKDLTFPNPSIRPVKNWTKATEITIGMKLYTIVDLDTSLQTLTTLVWFNMKWENEFIKWDPKQYCDIRRVMLTNKSYWNPDMYIYQRIDDGSNSPLVSFYSLDYKGEMEIAIPLRIVSTCKLDIVGFPFDTQKCNLTFGSYIHTVEDIIMVTDVDSSTVLNETHKIFKGKGDWNLIDIKVLNGILEVKGENYSKVTYMITIKREPLVYVITLIVPACFMVLLDIISMFIQMESGERLSFKITIVLGFSVLLLILNTMLPNSQEPPVLGIFCCVCMAVMVISILGCVTISYMLMISESQETVPSWIKSWILGYLARVLCVKGRSFMKYGINLQKSETYVNMKTLEEKRADNKRKLQKTKTNNLEVKLLKMLLNEVGKIHKGIVESIKMEDLKTEWHAAAIVVDRLVLIIYLFIFVILFAVVITIWYTHT
ncbi:5-hydroxytryptamine receptor 3A-like [Leptodactylus fuscus]|uniref:5-hydroxytryptamine receptor 3A-like n=1 Tax=Leptodactylus fuscus TaxID=238119 RepID=UPI003F4E95B3